MAIDLRVMRQIQKEDPRVQVRNVRTPGVVRRPAPIPQKRYDTHPASYYKRSGSQPLSISDPVTNIEEKQPVSIGDPIQQKPMGDELIGKIVKRDVLIPPGRREFLSRPDLRRGYGRPDPSQVPSQYRGHRGHHGRIYYPGYGDPRKWDKNPPSGDVRPSGIGGRRRPARNTKSWTMYVDPKTGEAII